MSDLVFVSLEAWDEVWRRNQYLVSGLLATDPSLRVLFVEPPDDPIHALRSRQRPRFGQPARQIHDRLWTVRAAKILPRRIDRHADTRLARAVVTAARRLGMRSPALWLNDPRTVEVAQLTGWPTVYDMTDDWLAADRPDAERSRLRSGEDWLLRNAAEVVACSAELARRKASQRTEITVIRNAVDVWRYQQRTARPSDLPPGNYVLYVGTLHRDRLDVELCAATARSLGDRARVVLVGPNALGSRDSQRLREAGVEVLGARPRDAVPAYLQHADALLVPHLVSDFTDSLDPLKLYEYQAVGRPVISTPVAGFRDANDERIRIAGRAEFAEAVAEAVASARPFPHGMRTGADDWQSRVAQTQQVMTALSRRRH